MTDPRFLLDSNICIYLLEGLSETARARVEACAPGEIVVSAISYAEVLRGLAPENQQGLAAMLQFARAVPVVPFDARAASAYRAVPFARARFDRLIAAHALALDVVLVTNNESDFVDVPGLKCENWTVPE